VNEKQQRALRKTAFECERSLEGQSRAAVFEADSRFHLELARLSGNRHLHETLPRLDARVQLCRMFLCLSDAKVRKSVLFHRRILAAMKDADAQCARELMREHLEGICL
jgi:DNA-binding GntR family transcriptional regulator